MQSRAAWAACCLVILAALTAAFGPAGCAESQADPPNPFAHLGQPPDMPQTAPATDGPATAYVPMVCLHLITIHVPIGTVSDSEQLWSCLNEEAVELSRSASLGANGFRIGLAPRAGWGELAGLIKRMTGRKKNEYLLRTLPGSPLHIPLKLRQPIQTMFTFYNDRTLSGADYPPGDNLLTVLCTFDEDDPNRVLVTACPQVRSTRPARRIVRRRGGLAMVSKPAFFPLRPLTFRLAIRSRDLIVIGPAPAALRPDSVGHHFLTSTRDGMEFESLLILIPSIERARVKHVPAGAPLRPAP